jgi:transposase
VREVLNAIFYVLATGCQWKALLKDLPPKSTAHSYFMLWDWNGTLVRCCVSPQTRAVSSLIESWGGFSNHLSSDSSCLLAKEAGMHVEEDPFA